QVLFSKFIIFYDNQFFLFLCGKFPFDWISDERTEIRESAGIPEDAVIVESTIAFLIYTGFYNVKYLHRTKRAVRQSDG
ncbi:MAG: hypothetical protein IKP86_04880, partial [Anaerolineaceae bacterium]|nr:hypothetical protein [Anaerolineaceae bacterium]